MITKSYTKTGRACRVTFRLSNELGADSAVLLGDFNGWSLTTHPLARRKDGSFALALSLETGRSYRFRYLVDGSRWLNDEAADGLVPNQFGSADAVLVVPLPPSVPAKASSAVEPGVAPPATGAPRKSRQSKAAKSAQPVAGARRRKSP